MKLEDIDVKAIGSGVEKWLPLLGGIGLAMFFGVGWIFIPFILLAFFFPSLFRIIYAAFLFVFLGTLLTAMCFLITMAFEWLPWSMASWWTVAKFLYVPSVVLAVYLSGDVDTVKKQA